MPPCKPVDFTVHSENGLGHLKRLPRETRDLIYSSIMPSLLVHPGDTTINARVVRNLVNAPILGTSKQLCVEFLEVFMQEVHLEESDEHYFDEESRINDFDCTYHQWSPPCLEELLKFIRPRTNFRFHDNKSLGLKIITLHLMGYSALNEELCMQRDIEELPEKLQRLWQIHENFGVPSDQIYLNIDYYNPVHWIKKGIRVFSLGNKLTNLSSSFWLDEFINASVKVTLSDEKSSFRAMKDMEVRLEDGLQAYKATKLRELQLVYPSEGSYQDMDDSLQRVLTISQEHCFFPLLEHHIRMAKMANGFWKHKEEQYSVWHLFDLAESWLEVKKE